MPLLSMFNKAIIILDGSDLCQQDEQREIWSYLNKIAKMKDSGCRVRISASSQDHTNVSSYLFDTTRLRMDDGFSKADINAFVDGQINSRTSKGQLLHDPSLRDTVERMLKEKADGMFLWASLVVEIILNHCRNSDEVRKAILEVPVNLKELYISCLRRERDCQPLCNLRLILFICAAPRPMSQEAVQQLLALDMETGALVPGRVATVDSILQDGVGLITMDETEQLILPAHDSVRKFIFSTAATPPLKDLMRIPDELARFLQVTRLLASATLSETREALVRSRLGKACCLHIRQRISKSLVAPHTPLRLDIPTITGSLPKWLRTTSQVLWPRASNRTNVSMSIPFTASMRQDQQDGFLCYAVRNWLQCNQKLEFLSNVSNLVLRDHLQLFKEIALQRTENWSIHPWPALARSQSQHLAGMFAYSVAYGHSPLLEVALSCTEVLPKNLFDGLLPNHGHLPALHVACKMGHTDILPSLLRVCKVSGTCNLARTALHYAAEANCSAAVWMLFNHFSELDMRSGPPSDYVDWVDIESRTALHLALLNDHIHLALQLVRDYGADTSISDSSGASCTFMAMEKGLERKLLDVFLDKNRAQLARLNERDGDGRTQLILAAMTGRTNFVESLRPYVDVDERDNAGMTALQYAEKLGHASVVKIIKRQYAMLDGKHSMSEILGITLD